MTKQRRVILGCFGSAGDVLPLVPVADAIAELGIEVEFTVSRSLGLYLRLLGRRAHSIGVGSEVTFSRDHDLISDRNEGRSSQARIYTGYLLPSLRDDVASATRLIQAIGPDLIVTTTFALALRVASLQLGIPHQEISIYPQFFTPCDDYDALARTVVSAVSDVSPTTARTVPEYRLAFGVCAGAHLLFEPLLLDPNDEQFLHSTGYPYFDNMASLDALRRVMNWIDESSDPVVLATLGSFVGLAENRFWGDVQRAVKDLGARALLVNAPHASVDDSDRIFAAPSFLPLSALLPSSAAIIHHGGIGTSLAAILSGVPAVVVPQAFDQPDIARRLDARFLAVRCEGEQVRTSLNMVLLDERYGEAVLAAKQNVIGPKAAAASAAVVIANAVP